MKPVLVYDLPTRFFHWAFGIGLLVAAGIGLFTDAGEALFPYHKIIGLILAAMVLLRIVWGFVGTRYARFGSFLFGPGDVIGYFKGVFAGGGRLYAGHNPASGHATFVMLALTLVIVGSGLLMAYGNDDVLIVHQISVYLLLGVIGVHILGVIVHTIRHHENITLSMLNGKKVREPDDAILSAKPVAALVFVVITALWAGGLLYGYDKHEQQINLPILGKSIQLGECGDEHEWGDEPNELNEHAEHHDDHDDD